MGARPIQICAKEARMLALHAPKKGFFQKRKALSPESFAITFTRDAEQEATSSLRQMGMSGVGGRHSLFPGFFSLAAVIGIHTLKKALLWEASPTMWQPPGYSPQP